jgi:uncharacterized membrane protein
MSRINKISDAITKFCGDLRFIFLHIFWWGLWIGFGAEPYPYGLLTLIVSLESIVLSTFILISQNRQSAKDRNIAVEDHDLDEESVLILRELKKKFLDG